jgi:hypothetical protein
MMTNGIEILPGHFGKVYRDGKVIARAYAQQDGTWRIAMAGAPEGQIVAADVARSWLAAMALVG